MRTIKEIVEQAATRGFHTLTGNEMDAYKDAWRAGKAEQWRATVSWPSAVTPGRLVPSDTFGVTRADCAQKVRRLLQAPGARLTTEIHQAFPRC